MSKLGRPTEYKDNYPQIAEDYMNQAVPENMEIPTMEGLALELDCDTDTLNEWSKKYPDFSGAIKKLKEKQKMHLMIAGMFGGKEVNPAMAIFLLKNNHGMKDRTDVTTNDKDLPQPLLGGISTKE